MNLKTLFLQMMVSTLICSSCSDGAEVVLEEPLHEGIAQESIYTYEMRFDAEIASCDGTTRGTAAASWKNGDVVYLHFLGSNDVFGKAVYVGNSNKWKVTCDKALANVTNAACNLWFGKGIDSKEYADRIEYGYMTEAYYTSGGQYSFSIDGLTVSATMLPLGWRLRFKGTAGDEIRISGQSYYDCMFVAADYISNKEGSVTLTVESNGYTDYYVGRASATSTTICLENLTTKENFTRFFDNNTLKLGETGCFTIPSSSNLYGWTLTSPSNTINGHEYVDLGLPSGTKWATCNVGASSPEEYGGYYAWGETEEKSYYDWSTYIHCDGSAETCHHIGDDIAGTEYDAAHVKWGGSWRMPSHNQIQELFENCTRTWTIQNGRMAYLSPVLMGRVSSCPPLAAA